MTLLGKISYEKKNVNKMVEEELDEFRREIDLKFAEAETKNFVMDRHLLRLPQKSRTTSSVVKSS